MKKIFIRIFSVKISDRRLHSFTQPGRFYTKEELSVWTNLGKRFVIRLVICVSSIKTGTRRIMRPGEIPFVVRRSGRISKAGKFVHKHNAACASLYT